MYGPSIYTMFEARQVVSSRGVTIHTTHDSGGGHLLLAIRNALVKRQPFARLRRRCMSNILALLQRKRDFYNLDRVCDALFRTIS